MTYRILTVCTGNICRSPMAEAMIRRALEDAGVDDVDVDSAATSAWEVGNPIDRRAGALLTERGYDASTHVARRLERSWLTDRDLVLVMDHDHYDELMAMEPSAEEREKIRLMREFDPDADPDGDLGIRDPWYGGAEDFETTYALIDGALPGIVDHVRAQHTD